MRTKRRYAHELYPHADDFERRPLETEVPYLYARAHGIDIYGTGYAMCFTDMDARREFQNRVMIMLYTGSLDRRMARMRARMGNFGVAAEVAVEMMMMMSPAPDPKEA